MQKMDVDSFPIWTKSKSMETFWLHNVTVHKRCFLAPEEDGFSQNPDVFSPWEGYFY